MFTCRPSNLKRDLWYYTINYYVLVSENIQTFVFFLPKLNIIRLNRHYKVIYLCQNKHSVISGEENKTVEGEKQRKVLSKHIRGRSETSNFHEPEEIPLAHVCSRCVSNTDASVGVVFHRSRGQRQAQTGANREI